MDVSVQIHTPAALPPGKDRSLGGSQTRFGRGDEEKNSHPPPGIEPYYPARPARSLVVIPTELSLLLSVCV
jgi:hypothetical protein